jgi:hypothetical protein
MVVFGITTTMSMWGHFAGAFFWGKMVKQYLPVRYAYLLVGAFAVLLEVYQLMYQYWDGIWWDTMVDLVMDAMGMIVALRWKHE